MIVKKTDTVTLYIDEKNKTNYLQCESNNTGYIYQLDSNYNPVYLLGKYPIISNKGFTVRYV